LQPFILTKASEGSLLLTSLIALKLILVSLLFGALIMFWSCLKVAKTGRTGVLGMLLLWAFFAVQVLIAAMFFTGLFLLMRFILG